MKRTDLGYYPELDAFRKNNSLESFATARVTSEHKERYIVDSGLNEFDAEIVGNLRFSANSRVDFPVVGDWVAISEYDDNKALIHAIYPRKNIIERQAIDKFAQKQIIAANIDTVFIVQAVDRDFNLNRIERYLTLCNNSHIEPIVVLTKIDLAENSIIEDLKKSIKERLSAITVLTISNETEEGYDKLKTIILPGKTYCLLGSSGVGKSSLSNKLAGKAILKTGAISSSTHKGKHITSHRELFVLKNGGILIDNPGMREVGIADTSQGLEQTFDYISEFANNCKFSNCSHVHEKGCEVIRAVNTGEIEKQAYENYLKLKREQAHFSANLVEKRKKDKEFGKMVKNVKKLKKSGDKQ